jgi:hypothetical protein
MSGAVLGAGMKVRSGLVSSAFTRERHDVAGLFQKTTLFVNESEASSDISTITPICSSRTEDLLTASEHGQSL